MNKMKEVGCYNVSINDGALNHEDNRWYYILQVDVFGEDEKWKEKKCFYIKGHTDGDVSEKSRIQSAVSHWFNRLTVTGVRKLYKNKENHRFEVVDPNSLYQQRVISLV